MKTKSLLWMPLVHQIPMDPFLLRRFYGLARTKIKDLVLSLRIVEKFNA